MIGVRRFSKRFFASPAPALFVALFGAFAVINSNYLDMGFLQLHQIDEYGFHLSLLDMYDGLREGNLRNLFGYRFYNYGFGFFLLNLFVTMPFLDGTHNAMAIYLPRMVTSLSALVGLYYLYRTAGLQVSALTSTLFVFLTISMPAFWTIGSWFHPDWLMTACLLVAFYHFACNDDDPGRNYWRGVLWFGLAAGLGKFQAFTFLPFLFFYVFHDELARLDFSHFASNLKRAVLSVAAAFSIFVALNPYLLHPAGLHAFLRILEKNMVSNTTGHYTRIIHGVGEKIEHAVFDHYLNPLLFLIFLGLIAFWCADYFRGGKRRSYQALAFYCAIYFAYLLFGVNKVWQHYYLGLLIPAVLLAPPLFTGLHRAWRIGILSAAILLQVGYYGNGYAEIARLSYRTNTAERVRQHRTISNFIVESLRDKVETGSIVLISPFTGFDFERLGLRYRSIFLTDGGFLSYEMIDLEALKLKYAFDPELAKVKISRFRQKDFIILNKAEAYFRPELRHEAYDIAAYDTSVEIIGQFDRGNLGYRKIAENKDVVIYQRIL